VYLQAKDGTRVGSGSPSCQLPVDIEVMYYNSYYDMKAFAYADEPSGFAVNSKAKGYAGQYGVNLPLTSGEGGAKRLFRDWPFAFQTTDYDEKYGFRYKPCTHVPKVKPRYPVIPVPFPKAPDPIQTPTPNKKKEPVLDPIEQSPVPGPEQEIIKERDLTRVGFTHLIAGDSGFSIWNERAWGSTKDWFARAAAWNTHLALQGWPKTTSSNRATTPEEMQALLSICGYFWNIGETRKTPPVFRMISADGDHRGSSHHLGWDVRPYEGTLLRVPAKRGLWFIRTSSNRATDHDGNKISQSQYHFIPLSAFSTELQDDYSTTNVDIWLTAGCPGLFDPEGKRVITHQHVEPSTYALKTLNTMIQRARPSHHNYVREVTDEIGGTTGFRVFYVDQNSIPVEEREDANWMPWVLPNGDRDWETLSESWC